jgi:hypothetical protein
MVILGKIAFTALALAAVSVAPSAAPAASTRPPAEMTLQNVLVRCFLVGKDFKVNAARVSIRYTPNGRPRHGIGRGAVFRSAWRTRTGAGPYYCQSAQEIAGQYWVYGWALAHPSQKGFVGRKSLTFYRNVR